MLDNIIVIIIGKKKKVASLFTNIEIRLRLK